MELFRGSFSKKENAGILSHFGSVVAAAHRLDSIYAVQHPKAFSSDGNFTVFDTRYRPIRTETAEEALQHFANFLQQAVIAQYSVDIKNPLELKDCWTDDPIGSGALEIFQDNKQLTKEQYTEVEKLFSPFKKVVYPEHVHQLLLPADISSIKKDHSGDLLFEQEMLKRKIRSEKIGIPFEYAEPQEVVWTDLTLKLRSWALRNGFDSFSYRNESEGEGEESYVTLTQGNRITRTGSFKFNKKTYLETIAPVFNKTLQLFIDNDPDNRIVTGTYWANHSPADFWIPA